jgi:hypothetical protein
MAEKRAFEYKPRSQEQYKQRATQRGTIKESFLDRTFPAFAPKKGPNKIRILPPTWLEPNHYGYDVWVHWGIGRDESSYVCSARTESEDSRCPICEEILETKDKEFANKIKANRRVLMWIIDRTDEDAGPKLWAMPWTLDKSLVLQSTDDTGDTLFIDRPNDGYDISFELEGERPKVQYTGEKVARNQSPISNDPKKMDRWLNFITEHPVPSVIIRKDYSYIKKVFEGGVVETSHEEVVDEVDDLPIIPKNSKPLESPEVVEVKLDYEDLEKMDIEELKVIASDLELGVEGDTELLIAAISDTLGLKKKVNEDTIKDRLANVRAKYARK